MIAIKSNGESFIGCWDAVPRWLCQQIIESHNRRDDLYSGTVGHEGRRDETLKVSTDADWTTADAEPAHAGLLRVLQQCLDDYLLRYADANAVAPFVLYPVYKTQDYKPGEAYFGRHSERMGPETSARHLVFTVYLNSVTDGGGTAFPNLGVTVDAVVGRVCIFPADWTHAHYGLVSLTQPKYIVTGWFVYRDSLRSASNPLHTPAK